MRFITKLVIIIVRMFEVRKALVRVQVVNGTRNASAASTIGLATIWNS